MPWWITSFLIPLSPALIAIFVGWAYVSFPRAVYSAIGQGQLLFVAVVLASRSLSVILAGSEREGRNWTIASLLIIIFMSVAFYSVATAWKHQQPPRQVVAGLLVIAGSLGLLLWAVSISVEVLHGT
jgi:hypothetical protein